MNRRKILKSILFLPILFLLTGCTSSLDYLKEQMWVMSGVESDKSYIQFRQMESANALDKEGLYRSKEMEEYQKHLSEQEQGSVHISFARNEFMNFNFFRNSEMDDAIDVTNCRMNPGDEIYSSVPEISEESGAFYQFSEIRILELNQNGSIKKQLASVKDLPGLLYRIPEDFTGTDIAILPLGNYHDRTVHMDTVQIHPDGSVTSLDRGTWIIDSKKYGNGEAALNPLESYKIIYDYSPYIEDYYFESSIPGSYWDNSNLGQVAFLLEPSDEDNLSYQVRLHPYGEMKINNTATYQNVVDSFIESASAIFTNKNIIETKNVILQLQVNGQSSVNNFSDTEITVPKLKAGDQVNIQVPNNMKLIAENIQIGRADEKGEFREYRFTIPDKENMKFLLSAGYKNTSDGLFHDLPVEHGDLSVFDMAGMQYQDGSELPAENEKVRVIITPEENYCIYGRGIKNNLFDAEMKYSDFESGLQDILLDHPIKPGIVVTLDTEDELGECVFWTGMEKISGTVVLREGQDLQFDYILNPDSGFEIILTKEDMEHFVDVWNPFTASRVIEVTDQLQGTELRCRDLITLQKGGATDVVFEDPY